MNQEQARRMMVDGQIRPSDVTDPALIAAMLDVPRERFVGGAWKTMAYGDAAIPLTAGGGRMLLAPRVFAKLVQAAAIGPGDVVLDVGCGTGYSAAVLARLASSVVALEEDETMAAAAEEALAEIGNTAVVRGPLVEGYPSEGPYDAILIEGAVEELPARLGRQLKEDGRLVAIVGSGPVGRATVSRWVGGAFSGHAVFDASAPVLPGFARPAAFVF